MSRDGSGSPDRARLTAHHVPERQGMRSGPRGPGAAGQAQRERSQPCLTHISGTGPAGVLPVVPGHRSADRGQAVQPLPPARAAGEWAGGGLEPALSTGFQSASCAYSPGSRDTGHRARFQQPPSPGTDRPTAHSPSSRASRDARPRAGYRASGIGHRGGPPIRRGRAPPGIRRGRAPPGIRRGRAPPGIRRGRAPPGIRRGRFGPRWR